MILKNLFFFYFLEAVTGAGAGAGAIHSYTTVVLETTRMGTELTCFTYGVTTFRALKASPVTTIAPVCPHGTKTLLHLSIIVDKIPACLIATDVSKPLLQMDGKVLEHCHVLIS